MKENKMSILERQSKYVFFPWSTQSKSVPLEIQKAEGVYFYLSNKQKILDFSSHVFNAHLGHGHQRVRNAIVDYAERAVVPMPSGVYEERALLGENLARITPDGKFTGLTKSFICLSGAEANENAIKMARLVTGRTKVMTRYRSYHGATLSALQYSGDYRRMPFDGMVNGVVRMPESVEVIEQIIEAEGPESIACMLLESIVGANGVYLPAPNYWTQIRSLCDKYGILLVADEVLTGFGRTGKWFGIEHFGVTPDLMTLSKGLTGGYAPLGAVVVNEKIARFFDNNKLWCGLTHYGHPLSCAVANAAIAAMEEEHLVENARLRGLELAAGLASLKDGLYPIAEIRSIGLLAALDLKNCATERNYSPQALQDSFLRNGLYCMVRFGTILLAPPLIISPLELQEGLNKIKRTLNEFFS